MYGVELFAIPTIQAGMARDHALAVRQLHHPGKGAQQQALVGVVTWDTVAIALEAHQGLTRGPHSERATTGVRNLWEGQQLGLFLVPQVTNGAWSATRCTRILGGTAVGELGVQRLPRGDRGNRDQ